MNKQFSYIFSFVLISFLLVMAIIYAKERVIYTDSANYLFFSIQSESFFIAHNRFIAYLFEIPLVIGIKCHLPLPSITLLYSLGYFIPDLIVLFILLFIFKDYTKATILILLLIVGNNYDFFYTASEFHKGIYFSLLFWSLIEKIITSEHKKINFLLLFILMIILIWSHPLIVFPMLFILIYIYINDKQFNLNKKNYITIFCTILLLIVFKFCFFKSDHENGKYGFIAGFIDGFPYYNTKLFTSFFRNSFAHQISLLSLVAINVVALIMQKKKSIILLFLFFLFGYWLLITASFYTNTYDFYIEHLYKPIVFFIVSVFCIDVIPFIHKKLTLFLLIIIAIYGVLKIKHTAKFYIKQQNKIETILKTMEVNGIQKGFMQGGNFKNMLNDDRWNSGVESLLLSSYDGKEKSKTLTIENNYEEVGRLLKNDSICFYQGYKSDQKNLNKNYFLLSDSFFYVKIDSLLNQNEK
jgi:hypothetical protein